MGLLLLYAFFLLFVINLSNKIFLMRVKLYQKIECNFRSHRKPWSQSSYLIINIDNLVPLQHELRFSITITDSTTECCKFSLFYLICTNTIAKTTGSEKLLNQLHTCTAIKQRNIEQQVEYCRKADGRQYKNQSMTFHRLCTTQ